MWAARPQSATAHFSLMFADQDGPEELAMELQRPRGAEVDPIEMSVRQALYILRSTLPVQGDVRRIEVSGSLRRPSLDVATDSQAIRWDVSNAVAPQLLEATARQSDPDAEQQVLHCGHRLGGLLTPAIRRALERLVDRHGHPREVGSPRVLGVAETLYLRTA